MKEVWTAFSEIFLSKPRAVKFSGDEATREMNEKLAEWKAKGQPIPSAPAERPAAGVMHGLGEQFPENLEEECSR